jgi:ABC-type multidrug transport system ATPase subunit
VEKQKFKKVTWFKLKKDISNDESTRNLEEIYYYLYVCTRNDDQIDSPVFRASFNQTFLSSMHRRFRLVTFLLLVGTVWSQTSSTAQGGTTTNSENGGNGDSSGTSNQPSNAEPTKDSDASPNHSPSGTPGSNLPAVDDTEEYEIEDCNLTIGYYMDANDDTWRLPDFSDRLGMPNIPCTKHPRTNKSNCTYHKELYNNTCDKGTVCVPYNSTNSTMTPLENNQTGRCSPCELGQTCPAGTVTKAYSIFENRCPPGKICESPKKEILSCPAGTFCPRGTFYEGMDGETECKSPGMYCPNGTKKDKWWCPNANFCPSVYEAFVCPSGHYCWEGSHKPQLCGHPKDITYSFALQACDTGTTNKPYSAEGTATIAIVVLSLVVIMLIVRCVQKAYVSSSKTRQKFAKMLARRMGGNAKKEADADGEDMNLYSPKRSFPQRAGVKFTYTELTLTVKAAGKDKVVVDHVSGAVPAATMTAVMGPSGAGKTSFMNVLCDRAGYGTTSGTLTLNGTPDRISNHRDIMGFVPQDDIVHDDLTVRENLMYAAMIRLPIDKNSGTCCRTTSLCQTAKRRYYKNYVDEVLEMLQIAHVQHSIVGSVEKRGISGGQRKRVNIGLELVADPDVLFLDEPTSGLDSTSAEIILAALKDLSRLGRTIIMVIHQPRYSIFASMDNVIFLGPGGKTVYSGSPVDATDYFEMLGFHSPPGVNRADYFMDVIGGTISRANDPDFAPSDLFELWKEWVEYSKSPSFQLEENDDDNSEDMSAYNVQDDHCVFRPKELAIVRELFVEALLECRATSSTALTNEKELKTFLLLVSEASIQEKISTRQALALGLVVRQAFYGKTKSLKIASNVQSMDNLRANSSLRGKMDARKSLMQIHKIDSYTNSKDLEMIHIPNESKSTDDGSRITELKSFNINGVLEWGDLAFTLNRADVMANLLQIRSLEVIGTDVEALSSNSSDQFSNSSGNSPLVRRSFGWDHKIAQLVLFSVRYIQKRDRGIKDWYMDCALLLGGAAVMGIIVGPTTKDTMIDTGSLTLNHLMIVLVYGTLATISSLPTFAQSKLMFWRESSQDVSILAIWLSRNVTDIAFILLQTLGFVGIVYDMTTPLMNITTYYYIYVAIGFANSGLGYFLSTFIPRRNLTLYSALLAVLVGAFFSGTLPYLFELQEQIINDKSQVAATKLAITEASYSRWSVEALVVTEILMAPPGIVSLYGAETFEKVGYASLNKMYRNKTIESYENPFARKTEDFLYPDMTKRVQGQALMSNLWPLFWIGIACRFLALGGLFVFDRKQQNKTACIDIILNAIFSCFTCNCCKTKNSSAKPTRNFKQLSRQVTNFQMSMNPFFGEKRQSGRDSLKSTKSAKLRKMYTDALQATSASVKDEGWLDRVQGHGLSSKVRQQRLDRKMGMLFDIWDKIGDGILDEDDMKSITKSLTSKVYAQFGDKESRQRLKNVGCKYYVYIYTEIQRCYPLPLGNKKLKFLNFCYSFSYCRCYTTNIFTIF